MSSKFVYEYSNGVGALETTENFVHVEDHVTGLVTVTRKDNSEVVCVLDTSEQFATWRDMLERDFAWKPDMVAHNTAYADLIAPLTKVASAVNPSHYKGYVKDMQWMETMGHLPNFRDLSNGKFYAAIELQIRKYLDRLGKKDAGVQELLKARWYTDYLIACMHTGRVVSVEEVQTIISTI
jgi:hypothetical protein